MTPITSERVPALTGLLTVVSLTLVFAAAGGVIPSDALPAPPEAVLAAIPTVNAIISLLAIGTIGLGWHWIRRGEVDRHRAAMVASTLLFATFLVLYLYRLVVVGGAAPFPGPETVYYYVYLPILIVHVGLAVVCIPLLYYVLLLALTHSIRDLRRTAHARVGRVVAPLWITSFALGVVVYVLLYLVY